MNTILTIGHAKKSLEEFVRALQAAGVDAVIDIRLRNRSQLLGYAKGPDLAFLLTEGFGIDYEYRPDLAPTAEALESYRNDGHWSTYQAAFLHVLEERQAEQILRDLLSRFGRPCLLCSEPTADRCHRRLVAEWWASRIPDLAIVHL